MTLTTSHTFRLAAAADATTVEILGTFGSDPETHWKPIALTKVGDSNEYEVTIDSLVPATPYFYKFKVNGEWVLDPNAATAEDDGGITNNVFT
ncbi:hypothetical protein GGI05_006033, partial [Coemansia sp. RSA 2603]